MLKWLSGDEGAPGPGGPPHGGAPPGGPVVAVEEMAERLSQTEQLVSQLKDMIREKDSALRTKDEQLKAEKEATEAKLSKLRLQNKAKVTSLSAQLEELKSHSPTHSKKGEGVDQAARGKVVLLKKKVEELEQQLVHRGQELTAKTEELQSQFRRGEEMDLMLTEKDRKLAEKEAYIVHLQTAMGGEQPTAPPQEQEEDSGSTADLQNLVQNLTKKIGEAEERHSLLQEQTDRLQELLSTEREQFSGKENMYQRNIQTFKDILLQKDQQLSDLNQRHEQELFRLAAKSDASADLEHLLKALKQKLHEKEEVLLGKTQVIDVLQQEVDTRDEQIKELSERLRRVQVEQRSLESKAEAERHVMRAQIRDLMDKHQSEVQRLKEAHQEEASCRRQEQEQRQELRGTEEEQRGTEEEQRGTEERIAQLEAKVKEKSEEAGLSEAKFLKIKAWSKSRVKQLEEELRRSQSGSASPDLASLRSQVSALEQEREETLWKLEQYEELRVKNETLEAKLEVYEEQQRTLQADLEQFTKRATSQASESGSADEPSAQVLEWQQMVSEAVSARDRAREEKSTLALRISHLEEEKEALASRQQELEDELSQSRGLSPSKGRGKTGRAAERSLQEDFELDGHTPLFSSPRPSHGAALVDAEGENMGGWFPEFSSPDTGGLRSVVEELELERNQLQEQILSLEERCQDLEDRLQLQARIETLQTETERLQSQLSTVRTQQSRDAEKHQLLVSSLNQQLRGLSDTQESLESSLIEKELTLAQTSEKLELISGLRESLREKETQLRETSERLLQTEHTLEEVMKKSSVSDKLSSELKAEVTDLTQKLSVLRDKAQKQESTVESLQSELDQTNEDLDKLNSAHLEERAQLIHDLQSCEREIDGLKDALSDRDKEIAALSGHVTEYGEQIAELKRDAKLREESLVQAENALRKAERDMAVLRDSQSSDQHVLNSRISEMVEKLKDFEAELTQTKEERDLKTAEVEQLVKQADEDKKTMQELRADVQKQSSNHRNHLSECETHVSSLKEQLVQAEDALRKVEHDAALLRDSQSSDQQLLNARISEMVEQLKDIEVELTKAKEERDSKSGEIERLLKEADEASDRLKEATEEVSRWKDRHETQEQKEQIWQNEMKSSKDEQNRLLAEVKALEENVNGKVNVITSLEKQIEGEREKHESENQKIRSDVSKLKNALKNLKTEKGKLNRELDLEKEAVRSLKEEKSKLELEKDGLNENITRLDATCSENAATVEALRRENEDLKIQAGDLNRVLEQSTHSSSEMLVAKTNECSRLSQLLREREVEVESLSAKVGNQEKDLAERDGCVSELRSSLDALQNQQKQLEEALSKKEEQQEKLKSESKQKDAALEEKRAEMEDQKNVTSKLETNVKALTTDNSQLREQLQEKTVKLQSLTEELEKQKADLDDANGLVQSLKAQVSSVEERVRNLEVDVECKQKEIQSRVEENCRLSNIVESKDKELVQATEQTTQLSSRVSSLFEDNQRSAHALERKIQEVNELNCEKSALHDQLLSLEGQKMNDKSVIEGLVKEKEEITLTITKLNKALNENELLNSQKTNDCVNLLREKEELAQNLQNEVDKLKLEAAQLNGALAEKDDALSESKNQHLQLEDTVSMLQEQGAVLKSALMEKDAALKQKTEETDRQKDVITKAQKDLDLLQEEVQQMKTLTGEKEQTLAEVTKELQSHKDELNKRNESVLALSTQLGAMNENTAELESNLTDVKAAVERLTSENSQLLQEAEQRNAQIVDLQDGAQVLKEQSQSLKTELLKSVTELSTLKEQVQSYRAAVEEGQFKMSALANELKMEKDRFSLSVQGNEDVHKQHQETVQKLNAKVDERERELQQRSKEKESLSAQVSELERTIEEFKKQTESLTSESQSLKADLDHKEKERLELESSSSAAAEKLHFNLQTKEGECQSLKEQVSSLEEAVAKLDSSLQVQMSETQNLQKTLMEREEALAERSKSIDDLQRREDEALMFKSQFVESTELVSKLQNECETLRNETRETQSAFNNLQEKFATNLEELKDVKHQLSLKEDAVSSLQKLLQDGTSDQRNAQSMIEELRVELADVRQQLEKAQSVSVALEKEKGEALASHQESVAKLTVEIDRLKSQHVQVVSQMDALTGNIEQREMALHAINNQYAAQAKHAAQLVTQIQTLEEQNAKLREKSKESDGVSKENAKLQERLRKTVKEKKDLERQLEESKAREEAESSSREAEKNGLRSQVSARDDQILTLKDSVAKVEQILQDSEKEWLLALEQEKQEKSLITERLRCVENEARCKDVKVIALKDDLDSLQGKLSEAVLAVKRGSEQLLAKEQEASVNKSQLENVLALIQEKDDVNNYLQRTFDAAESELRRLASRSEKPDEPKEKSAHLLGLIKDMEQSYTSEVDGLKSSLDDSFAKLKQAESNVEKGDSEKLQQISLLQESLNQVHTKLDAEAEKVKEAAVKYSTLYREVQAKEEHISCMDVQIAQQKELLAGLSQQLKDKDASVVQVMEAAASERVRATEEIGDLKERLEKAEHELKISEERCRSEVDASNSEMARKNEEFKVELAKTIKEKDALKKKLQAALVVRKELMKKIETLENEDIANYKSQVSKLSERLQEAETQHQDQERMLQENIDQKDKELYERKAKLDGFEAEMKSLKEAVHEKELSLADAKLSLSEKDSKIDQLQANLMENENTLKQENSNLIRQREEEVDRFETEIQSSNSALKDKELRLADAIQELNERDATIERLQASFRELEQEKSNLLLQLEEVQNEVMSEKASTTAASSTAADLEKELAQLKKEKATLQKKAQAALLARKESMKKSQETEKKLTQELAELKEESGKRQEQQKQQSDELDVLREQLEEKLTELEESERLSVLNKEELESWKHRVEERDRSLQELKLLLADKENQCQTLSNELETVKTKMEDVASSYTNEQNSLKLQVEESERHLQELKSLLEDKESQCSSLSAAQSELQTLKAEVEDMSLSHTSEVDALRRLLEEKDRSLQEFRVSLADREGQCQTLANAQSQLEMLQSKTDSLSHEMSKKDEDLAVLKKQVGELESRLTTTKSELEKAQNDGVVKAETIKSLEEQIESEKLQRLKENEVKDQFLRAEHAKLLEKCDQLKVELETALVQKSSEVLTLQNKLEETQRLMDHRDSLCEELEVARRECDQIRQAFNAEKQRKENALDSMEKLNREVELLKTQLEESKCRVTELLETTVEKANVDTMFSEKDQVILETQARLVALQKSLEVTQEDKEVAAKRLEKVSQDFELEKQEKESALGSVETLKQETAMMGTRLNETQKQNIDLTDKLADLEATLTQKEATMLEIQGQLLQKQQLIAALEVQLQQQSKIHDVAVEKMKIQTAEVQMSTEDATKAKEQEVKIAQLTKKLQAALVSRKELLKGNAKLKDDSETLSAKFEATQVELKALDASNLSLKQRISDLELSLQVLNKEKESLKAESEGLLGDNRSLSAACESLKQTIENITQQKQAFSCQLESLKDSQTEELTKWKTKHSELKQEYESLLQAYENVSSEMDKMRQLLEGAKRERQEAVRKSHKLETDLENLERQLREFEGENEKLRDGMQGMSEDKTRKLDRLEEENKKIGHLECDVARLMEMIEEFKKNLAKVEAEKLDLIENLSEAKGSLEEKRQESKSYAEKMQAKLDEALSLNNSLTVRIETQKTELSAQLEISQLLQREKQSLAERMDKMQNDHELELGNKEEAMKELSEVIAQNTKATISLNEKVRILEDDKTLLQEELENAQETSDKVKNENEYLETVILKNSEKIDELTESISTMQSQSAQLSSQLTSIKEMSDKIRQEKEQEQVKLVKEFEEKLRTMQRGNEGSKNVKKELQELLKEKHQEINLLQQNCINYQEVMLNLESSLKTSQSECEKSAKDLKQSLNKVSALEERRNTLENELATSESLLNEAKEKLVRVEAEREQLRFQLEQSKKREQDKLSRSIEEVDLFVEKNVLQQQIEDLRSYNSAESQKATELQRTIDEQQLQISALKRAAETSQTQLTALTSSPQGGDAAKAWSELYQRALSEKDNQLLEQGVVIRRFLEETRLKEKEVNELKITKSKLERTLSEYSMAAAAHQRQLFVMSASNAELNEMQEMLSGRVKELTVQVERLELDRNTLNKLTADKEDAISQLQLKLEQFQQLYADSNAHLQSLQAQNDKLQVEFDKQDGISQQLKVILQSKNAEISSLLSCKEGQMSGYLEQLQLNYQSQMSMYEDRLSSARYQRETSTREIRRLEVKGKSLEVQLAKALQEKNFMATKTESLKNSLASLQNEREKLTSDLRVLEAKSQTELTSKSGDGEGGGAAKGLKHEIRKLLHQMDDLNSENAMLRAQLVRYREDLNQVLSLKDNQLKVLLRKQQDAIKQLESDKMAAEKQIRDARMDSEKKEETSEALTAEISKLKSQVSKLERDRKEMTATNEGKVIVDLQNAVVAKAAECNDLQQKLLSERSSKEEVKFKLQQIETETDAKLAEAEDKYNSELDNYEREVSVMRSEHETADQRLAELARDLLETEQRLSEANARSNDAKTQNESLRKAMAALQDDRDQLIDDFKTLRNRHEDELRQTQAAFNKMERQFTDAASELAGVAKQRDVLAHRVRAAEGEDAQGELSRTVEQLSEALAEREAEVTRLKAEKETCDRKLSAFSRSMASLQSDRERLMDELAAKDKRSVENTALDVKQKLNDEKEVVSREETTALRSEQTNTEQQTADSTVGALEKERLRLHQDLQRCLFEIHRRDQFIQQLSTKLQQVEQENTSLSHRLRDTHHREGALCSEVAPGAPQERGGGGGGGGGGDAQLRDRLQELELSLTEETRRRGEAEEALRTALLQSRETQRDFSVAIETDDEWDALSLDPNQPLLTRKVHSSLLVCRQWLRGRSLYFSRLLRGRTRGRYVFIFYFLSLHLLLLLCLSGAL